MPYIALVAACKLLLELSRSLRSEAREDNVTYLKTKNHVMNTEKNKPLKTAILFTMTKDHLDWLKIYI